MKLAKHLGIALLMLAATLAASTAAVAAPGRSCFWARSVDSFRSPDSETVYLRAHVRDVYELKLFAPCLDVDWAHHIVLRSRGSSFVCEGTVNNVEIIVHSVGGHRQHCQVSSVRKLTPDEVSALPKSSRP